MKGAELHGRFDPEQLAELREAERPSLAIRWWLVLPVGMVLCAAQAVLNLALEFSANPSFLIATQISIIAFAFLMVLAFAVNPLLRLTTVVRPLNRGEMMTLFAALFVSAGICTFGLADQLIPIIPAPFDPQWNTPQKRWDVDVIPYLNRSLYITDTEAINQFRQGFGTREGLWRKIPWGVWAKPVSLWLIFVFAVYLMFYSLSALLYDSWARREKLIFPLARLPEAMLEDEGAKPGTLPSTLRSGLFWIGFLGVFALLSYNACCEAGWIRGLKPITLGVAQPDLKAMLENSIFRGIAEEEAGQTLMILVGFTAVGIGFLLPLEISASLWIYYLIGIAMFLIAIWTAVGSSVLSFPTDWLWENNFVSSLGAGGLLAFSASYLAKLVHEKWSEAKSPASSLQPGVSAEEAGAEGPVLPRGRVLTFLQSLGWGGLLFLVSVIVSLAWLAWSGVGLGWGFAFLAIVVLLTVGLMRVVAEGGVYWFQIHTGPFHLARMAGGSAVVPASALAALMPIYSVLFLDIKTFMAPAVLNSFKMQEETRAARRTFHLVVVFAILVTVVVSLAAILYFAYERGSNLANEWFFRDGPLDLLQHTQQLVSGTVARPGGTNWIFYLLGAGWVALSILMRRRFFWWLHPIGVAMMANPLMTQLWFSFFLGWCCKKMAVKYGGRHMFARLRPLFIGLIFGELVACVTWALVAHAWHLSNVMIDINWGSP